MPERPTPTPEQALNDAEAALARGEVPTWEGLKPEPPRLDPDEPRRSAAELCLLMCALGQRCTAPARPEFSDDPSRAGYRTGILDGTPVSWPAFAEALTHDDPDELNKAAVELWRVDAAIYSQLRSTLRPTLAKRWLTSPGRRLLQDLGLLTVMAMGSPKDGATDLSWARLLDAAGATGTGHLAEHAAIHAAWPGGSLGTWKPRDVTHALFTLEQGWPAHARGGALCWLLRQATTEPIVSLAGVRRHLGDELPGRIALAFSKESPAARVAARMAEVEALCLTHAARIAHAHDREDEVEATWHLARWIQTTTWASPFYGGDLESLAARLRALLPAKPSLPVVAPPPLAPARFGAGAREHPELDLTEHAWVIAVADHYPDAEAGLRPVPQPLVDGLRALAARSLTAAELSLERGLGEDTPHVAPPLIARRVLSEGVRASWLSALTDDAGAQLCALIRSCPARVRWLATASLDDGDGAPRTLAMSLLSVWRDATVLEGWDPEERCALGLGLSAHWLAGDVGHFLQELEGIPSAVSPLKISLVRQFLRRAASAQPEIRERVLTALLADAEDPDIPGPVRIDALGAALPWLGELSGPVREVLLDRARRLAEQRPFRDSVPLRRELRRLGLGAA